MMREIMPLYIYLDKIGALEVIYNAVTISDAHVSNTWEAASKRHEWLENHRERKSVA